MRVDRVEVYYVTLPLIYPWRTAYGEDPEIHSVLVRMESDGHEGWGETTPLYAPTYSPECAMSAYFIISEFFAPAIVGHEIDSAESLLHRIRHFKGNPFARAGIESAWWMLHASLRDEPLHRLLGGERRPVDAGADFGVQDSIEMLLEKIEGALSRGHKRVKLKVRPGWDLDMLREVRATFPNLRMHIDCNSQYSLDDLDFFRALDPLRLEMIEQPLFHTDLHDHAALQRHIETPICLDESITSVRDFELALRLGACRILNIKYSRVGGISIVLRLHDMARDAGIPCWIGSMLESGIGASINIELATLPNCTYPGDLFESRTFYTQDLTEPELTMQPGCTFLPSPVPATPNRPIKARVRRATRHSTVIERDREHHDPGGDARQGG